MVRYVMAPSVPAQAELVRWGKGDRLVNRRFFLSGLQILRHRFGVFRTVASDY